MDPAKNSTVTTNAMDLMARSRVTTIAYISNRMESERSFYRMIARCRLNNTDGGRLSLADRNFNTRRRPELARASARIDGIVTSVKHLDLESPGNPGPTQDNVRT